MARALLVALAFCMWPGVPAAGQRIAASDGIELLVLGIENALKSGNAVTLRSFARFDVDQSELADFVGNLTTPTPTNATVKERDRVPLRDGRQRVLLEILTERDREGRVSTWRLDVAPPESPAPTGPTAAWQISSIERLTVVSGLYRLALDTTAEYAVRNLTLHAPDLALHVPSGRAFMARSTDGPTALVILGRGRLQFSPKPEAERVQVKIFCGREALDAEFDSLFVRINPNEFPLRVPPDTIVQHAADAGDARRAAQLFETYVPQSFQIDLSDLSPERWSIVPTASDFVAEIVTRRYGSLTYARANAESEDISFFDRKKHKNISVYASDAKLAERGRFFSEDDEVQYDVTSYDLQAAFSPDRFWIDGRARVQLQTRDSGLAALTLRLADPLVVRSITSPEFGRLLFLRIVGQNSVLVNFPATIPANTQLELSVVYGGRLQPQEGDREALLLQDRYIREEQPIQLEPSYVYSNRSYWYPQSTVTDYATASMRIIVPADYDVVASGAPRGAPLPIDPSAQGQKRKEYSFDAAKPVRYLACVISRFRAGDTARLDLPASDDPPDAGRAPLALTVETNPRQFGRARSIAERTADILGFYSSLMGDAPYATFTVAVTESDLPGGHSPAYFAILNQTLPMAPLLWRNDPVSFDGYPSFFIAHEVAHQWWGQAVGWKNYHEQWLSEGFAQYFAALYAERERGSEEFTNVIRQMRRWAIEMSPNGPVYLGYRLGHIRSNSRVYRALVYNKGAMVLHMLRRLVGDKAFFGGLRDFYATWRFRKAGTDDFRKAMEAASGRPLERFFETWIYGGTIPTIRFTVVQQSGSSLRVRFDQPGQVCDVPVTVTISYADGSSEDVIVPVTEKSVEQAIPLKGTVRSVDVNRDGGALVEIEK
jgi:hypothetical protein